MKRPFFNRFTSRSAIPSSGGLIKSSPELTHITGALIFELPRRIVVPRCVHLVEEIVGI